MYHFYRRYWNLKLVEACCREIKIQRRNINYRLSENSVWNMLAIEGLVTIFFHYSKIRQITAMSKSQDHRIHGHNSQSEFQFEVFSLHPKSSGLSGDIILLISTRIYEYSLPTTKGLLVGWKFPKLLLEIRI